MNLPNKLSLARIYSVPIFLACLLSGEILGYDHALAEAILRTAALLIVIAVAYTDWLDGHLARKHKLTSNLGKLLDPLADKVFVTAALVGLVEIGDVPAWAVALIVAREFLITGLRSLALEAGRVISADRLGKHKTGWQLGLIISNIVALALGDYLRHAGVLDGSVYTYYNWFHTACVWIPLSVTLALTVLSGWNYARANIDLLKD